MNRPTLFILNIAVVVAIFFGSGAQLLVLQSVAWTNMLITYSQDAPIVEAVQKTFDGKHPCELCKHIQSVEKETNKNEGTTSSSQPLFQLKAGVMPTCITIIPPTGERFAYAQVTSAYSLRFTQPLLPPPRA